MRSRVVGPKLASCAGLAAAILAAACGGSNGPEGTAFEADTVFAPPRGAYDVAAETLLQRECPVPTAEEIDHRPPPEWESFRASHPYHIQTIALGAPRSDGTRILAITEPPPWVCVTTLKEAAPELRDIRVQQWRVGHDGWVRDATVLLPPLDSLRLGLLLQDVHRTLFGTTYKAETLPLRPSRRRVDGPLDMRVSAAELDRWLLLDAERFAPRGIGQGRSVEELLTAGENGVYYSTTPGLTVWVLPRLANITGFRVDARRWALDSDIVLGAVADQQSVAIVARERVTPPEFLPPLRVETIFQLASVGTEHLAQSYERTFALAGRTSQGEDWAPVYLSPELLDTEYGSLLNLTDQMLKSWSEHGQIRYANFEYPSPGRYPFDQGLFEELNASQVTYNWNTKGAGYVIDKGGLSVYALNRTGALPVSYFTGDDQEANDATLAAERRGYAYFAGLRDPNLARVVQYAALYQIFRAFGVTAVVKQLPPQDNQRAALRDQVRDLMTRFARDDVSGMAEDFVPEFQATFLNAHRALKALAAGNASGSLDRIADRLVRDPRDSRSFRDDAELEFRMKDPARGAATSADSLAYGEAIAARILAPALRAYAGTYDRSAAMRTYEQAAPAPRRGWIHTATIVRSWNTVDLSASGGHNLDASVTHFRASSGMRRGEIHVSEQNGARVILASEDDIARMSSDLRSVADASDENAIRTHLGALLNEGEAILVRARASVLPAPTRGATRGLMERPGALRVGYEELGRNLTPVEHRASSLLQGQGRTYTGVTKRSDGSYEIVLGAEGEVVRAPNLVSALDVVTSQAYKTGPSSVRQFQLYGFDDLGAATFSRDVELTLRRRGMPEPDRVTSVALRRGADEQPAMRGAVRPLGLRSAKVTNIREAQVDIGGVLHRAYEVNITVAQVASRPLLVRIWIVFKNGVARPTIEAVQAQLARILEAMGRDVPADLAAAVIRRQLRKSFGSIDLVHTQFDDVILAYAPTPLYDSGRNHTAG